MFNILIFLLKEQITQKNWNSVIYSTSCYSKPVWLTLFLQKPNEDILKNIGTPLDEKKKNLEWLEGKYFSTFWVNCPLKKMAQQYKYCLVQKFFFFIIINVRYITAVRFKTIVVTFHIILSASYFISF